MPLPGRLLSAAQRPKVGSTSGQPPSWPSAEWPTYTHIHAYIQQVLAVGTGPPPTTETIEYISHVMAVGDETDEMNWVYSTK